ncbi:MAG TPA: NUDIX domain-containing protein [Polyangiaceae bacterium]|jgi:8-oxo-dGTP pyrophosphatase MutT (NUDIX family)|nr:NUDIX domain-containing protein [Polyangiaceae bacterium]
MATEPFPSATVVIIRDGTTGVEVLMLQRNVDLSFHGGAWVFPGGRIDPIDRNNAGSDDIVEAARHAAVREAAEEASVTLDASELVAFSRWVTPEALPKRFVTWFFACEFQRSNVVVDGGEVVDHRWLSPSAALASQASGELDLPAPTYVTLRELAPHATARAALEALRSRPLTVYNPKMLQVEDGVCTVYEEDVAYGGADLETPGRRHRLYMSKSGYRYEHTG